MTLLIIYINCKTWGIKKIKKYTNIVSFSRIEKDTEDCCFLKLEGSADFRHNNLGAITAWKYNN